MNCSSEMLTGLISNGRYVCSKEPEIDVGTYAHDRTEVEVLNLQSPTYDTNSPSYYEKNDGTVGNFTVNSNEINEYTVSAPLDTLIQINVSFSYNTTSITTLLDSYDIGILGSNNDPRGITWDGTSFYVTDYDDSEVYKYNSDFTILEGSYDTAFNGNQHCCGIVWDGTYFYVTDKSDGAVYKYNPDFSSAGYYDIGNLGGNDAPMYITWDGTYFYVTDDDFFNPNDIVYKYNSDFTTLEASYCVGDLGDNDEPYGIVWDGNYFYLTDYDDGVVYKYNSEFTSFMGSYDIGILGDNDNPMGIGWDGTYFYVTDGLYDDDGNIYKYTPVLLFTENDNCWIENFSYQILGVDYYENYTLKYNSDLSCYESTISETSGNAMYYFDSSMFSNYDYINDLFIPKQNLTLKFSVPISNIKINFSMEALASTSVWKAPTEVSLEINGDMVLGDCFRSEIIIFMEHPMNLIITSDIEVHFKLNVTSYYSFIFDLDVVSENCLKKEFIPTTDRMIFVRSIEVDESAFVKKIYFNNVDLGGDNPNMVNKQINMTDGTLNKLDFLVNIIPPNWVFYCSTELQIDNALLSIGAKMGTISLTNAISLEKTVLLNRGADITFTGGALDAPNGNCTFNISDSFRVEIRDMTIDQTAEQGIVPAIFVKETADNIVKIENVNFVGTAQNGVGCQINSSNVEITRCTFTDLAKAINVSDTCTNGLFWDNYFHGNSRHVYDGGSGNDWNNTICGNYWDDHESNDIKAPFGICDDPYAVPSASGTKTDFRPLYDGGDLYHNGATEIHVNDLDFTMNWSWARTRKWCYGFGTWREPYVVYGLTIDAGDQAGVSGIFIENSDQSYFRIEGCTVTGSGSETDDAGVKFDNVDLAWIVDSTISGNNGHGAYITGLDYGINISDSVINENGLNGVCITGGRYHRIIDCEIQNNRGMEDSNGGVKLKDLDYSEIVNVNLTGNDKNGVSLDACGYVNVSDCRITGNGLNGLRFNETSDCEVFKNAISDNGECGVVILRNSLRSQIYKNFISDNTQYGAYIVDGNCDNNKIRGNWVSGNTLGNIRDNSGQYNTIGFNALNGKVESIVIDNDQDEGNFTWIQALKYLYWVNGQPSNPYCFEGVEVVSTNGWAALIVADTTNEFVINGCTFSNAFKSAGAYLLRTENGNMTDCTSNNNKYGVVLDHTNFTKVENCEFIGNGQGILEVENTCHSNLFINNVVLDNVDGDRIILEDDDGDDGDSNEANPWIFVGVAFVGGCVAIVGTYAVCKQSKKMRIKKANIGWLNKSGLLNEHESRVKNNDFITKLDDDWGESPSKLDLNSDDEDNFY